MSTINLLSLLALVPTIILVAYISIGITYALLADLVRPFVPAMRERTRALMRSVRAHVSPPRPPPPSVLPPTVLPGLEVPAARLSRI